MRYWLLVIAFATGLCAAACDTTPKEGNAEARPQGTWTIVSITDNGESVPRDKFEGGTFVIRENKLTMVNRAGAVEKEFGVRLGRSGEYQTLDLVSPGSQYMEEDVTEAIYELTGDTLRICIASPSQIRRPTRFESPRGSHMSLVVLERAK